MNMETGNQLVEVLQPTAPATAPDGAAMLRDATFAIASIPPGAPALPFDDWLDVGRGLYAKRKELDWQCADWLAYGLTHHAEQMKLALPEFATDAIEQKRLVHSAKIAAAIPASQRDTALTFAHHEHVADFPLDERLALLAKARENKWSARVLRIEAMGERARLGIGNMLIDDPDWEYDQHMAILRAWNRAHPDVRENFLEMANESNLGVIEE
jgi:hypothetical protein